VVLADHVKSVDWKSRRAKKKGEAPVRVAQQVIGKLQTLLNFS